MGDNENEVIKFFKKIEPLIALGILITLIITGFLLYQDNELKKEIGENCGYETKWGGVCYCDEETVMSKKIEWEEYNNEGGYLNVSLAG